MFQHFVITRFNIPLFYSFPRDKNDNAIDASWLKDRVDLFESYCFPSICSQICKNFVWLVFFDKDSPKFLKDKIIKWKIDCPQFVPIFVRNYGEFMQLSMRETINKMIGCSKFVITTRLDNDDILLDNAIEAIQLAFIPRNNIVIDIEDGFCYDKINHILCLVKKNRSNQFISLIERKDMIRTVFFHNHRDWIDKADYVTINKPLWVEIVHDRNLYNRTFGEVLFSKKKYDDLSVKDINISVLNSLLYWGKSLFFRIVRMVSCFVSRNIK